MINRATRLLAQQPLAATTVGDLCTHFARRADPAGATRVAYAQRLHRDVPIRLARRVVGLLEGLPTSVRMHPAFTQLIQQHETLLASLQRFPYPKDSHTASEFTAFHRNLRRVHGQSFVQLNAALVALPADGEGQETDEVTEALDAFFASRITVRMLIDQLHLLYVRQDQLPAAGAADFGVFSGNVNVGEVLREVCDAVQPDPALGLRSVQVVPGDDAELFHVPGHVRSVVSALVQNAVEAVCAKHSGCGDDKDNEGGRGGEVTLRCLKISDGRVEVQINDNGPGVGGPEEVAELFRYSKRARALGAETNALDDPILMAASRRLNQGLLTGHSPNRGTQQAMAGIPAGWAMTPLGPRMVGSGGSRGGHNNASRAEAVAALPTASSFVGLPVARCLARTFWGDILIRTVREAGKADGAPSGTETTLRLDSVDWDFQLVA